ncbi:MAG: hypothetical protein FWF77_07310 [Defluviitaleaceae bacterium]|nr:hypothetical protein [Defluviitaleaceae bacterium]
MILAEQQTAFPSAPSARWAPGTCVGGDAFSRSREQFSGAKKARQARGGHRGHVLAAAHSLEAGSSLFA